MKNTPSDECLQRTFNLDRIQAWYDQLELAIEVEAKQAGLFEHGSMTGAAREFLVRRVLRSVLPPAVHIGSGKVIDAYGGSSRQVDIVLYDARFPVFEVESGIGLYVIEGVIATIEVKSTITHNTLFEALDNVRSVIELAPHFEPEAWENRVKEKALEGLTLSEATRRVTFEVMPAAFVFGYSTRLRKKALATAVGKWFDKENKPSVSSDRCPILPRIIVAGKTMGFLDDGALRIDPGDDIWANWRREHGESVRFLMGFWDADRRFGLLASRLVQVVCNRIGLAHGVSGGKYDVRQYAPYLKYIEQQMNGRKAYHLPWEQAAPVGGQTPTSRQ